MQKEKEPDGLRKVDLDTKPVAAKGESGGSSRTAVASNGAAPGNATAPSGKGFMGCQTEMETRNAKQFQDRRARHEESHHSPI